MSTENLNNQEAVEKLRKLVDGIDIGMLGTYSPNTKFIHAIPMSRQEIDAEGNIWFLFSTASDTYQNLQANQHVSILYSDIKAYNFLSVNGIASISQDRNRIEKYWNKFVEAWFEKGKEDPAIRILKITPIEAHYWDNKSNKLVSILKVAASALTGAKLDIGREGDLNL